MATSIKAFNIELYEEYLEEASFLYEQRLGLFDDPEVNWIDIGEFEERFEAHIDGLVVGEELALEVCKRQAVEGDFGELHAAVRVFCRQGRHDLFNIVLEEVDLEDADNIQAIGEALKHEIPEEWVKILLQRVADGEENLIPALATILGFRREKRGGELLKLVQNISEENIRPEFIWALGRLGEKPAKADLLKALESEEESLSISAGVGLLRFGDKEILRNLSENSERNRSSFIPLALGTGPDFFPFDSDELANGELEIDFIKALGILGDIRAIELLLQCVSDEEKAESCAVALNQITGAELYEEVFIPEEIDEDELFPEELEKFKEDGELPQHVDGRPFGENMVRLSQNPEDWESWWSENQGNFDPEIRYRSGTPYSPKALLDNLVSEKSYHFVRNYAYEELVIRYGCSVRFETDMLVEDQKKAINEIATWVHENERRFEPGKWYFAGSLLQ